MIPRHPVARRPARQHGVVAVYVAIFLIAMLTAVMLAVEVGRIFLAHRQLQKMASLAALDGVRKVSACDTTIDDLPTQGELEAEVNQSLDRNGDPADLEPPVIEAGRIQVDPLTGRRFLVPNADLLNAQAVRVGLRAPFPQLLTGFLSPSDGMLEVSATAEQAALGSFFLGSGVLGVDTAGSALLNPLLTGLFGSSVNLSAIQYDGLAGANISLRQLATALDVEVRDLSNPTATNTQLPFVLNELSPLVDGSVAGTGQTLSNLLQQLGAAAAGNSENFPLSDLIGMVDDRAPDAPVINLLDLIVALGAAAAPTEDGEVRPIDLEINLNGGPILQSAVFIQVLEPPQFSGLARPGQAQASTAQIRLMLRLQATALSTLQPVLNTLCLGGLLCTVTASNLNLGVDVDVASASALLDRVQCPGSANPEPIAHLIAQTQVADVTVGTFSGSAADAPDLAAASSQLLGANVRLGPLGVPLANIDIRLFLDGPVSADVGSTESIALNPVTQFTRCLADGDPSEACRFSGTAPAKPYWLADVPVTNENPQTAGSSELLGSTLTTLIGDLELRATSPTHTGTQVCVLLICVPLGPVLDNVVTATSGLLGTVLGTVGTAVDSTLDPLLATLGIELGQATVTMSAVTIDQPRIVSTALPPAP